MQKQLNALCSNLYKIYPRKLLEIHSKYSTEILWSQMFVNMRIES